MTSREVGVGLVGSGFIARVHAEAFSRSTVASVRAVASRLPDRAAAFASQLGIPAWYTDYRELVERPMSTSCASARLTGFTATSWSRRPKPASMSSAKSRWRERCGRPTR